MSFLEVICTHDLEARRGRNAEPLTLFEFNGLEFKGLEFKGLESKGLESKGLESKGLEFKELESASTTDS